MPVGELHAMLCRGVSPGQVWGRSRCLRDAGDEDPPQFRGKKLPVVVLKSPAMLHLVSTQRSSLLLQLKSDQTGADRIFHLEPATMLRQPSGNATYLERSSKGIEP